MQHSPTAAALSTSFLLIRASAKPQAENALTTRFREPLSSVSMSRESKKIEEIKQRLVEFWQCITNTANEKRNSNFHVSPFAR